jgi:hypothetical protein
MRDGPFHQAIIQAPSRGQDDVNNQVPLDATPSVDPIDADDSHSSVMTITLAPSSSHTFQYADTGTSILQGENVLSQMSSKIYRTI